MRRRRILAATVLAGLCALAGTAHATDRFKVTSVDCETFSLWRHTPTVHYDIVDERRSDYLQIPASDYFSQAAERTAAYCDRTSKQRQQPLGPPRTIRGVWFQSNDEQFKILYSFDQNGVDLSAGVVNRIGDRFAADRLAADQQAARLNEARTREDRGREAQAARTKAEHDAAAAESARESLFFARRDLQVARLGVEVTPANFAQLDAVRTNPFHFRKLGLAVVRTRFAKMVSEDVALFGDELAPVFVRMDDVDRFTRPGETVMLALRVAERGEVERSAGSLPEAIMALLKREPIYGSYVGAYTCPSDDCGHVFDVTPPT